MPLLCLRLFNGSAKIATLRAGAPPHCYPFSGAPLAARPLQGLIVKPTGRRHQPGGAGKATSGLKECQQVGIELVFVRVREAVGCARIDL
jgi:hypothetical protein